MTTSGRITSLVFVSCTTTIAAFIGTGGVSQALQQHQLTGYETTQPCQEFGRNACHQAQVDRESWGLAFLNGQVGRLPAMAARAGIYSASFLLGGKGGFVVAGAVDMLGALPTSAAASPSSAGSVCVRADGIPGIESPDGRACCPASCGQCGGWGCSMVGDASDCCVSMIVEYGKACSDTAGAPCFIGDGTQDEPPKFSRFSEWTFAAFWFLKELTFYYSASRAMCSFYSFMRAFLETRRLARAAHNVADPAHPPAPLTALVVAALNAVEGMMRSVEGAS